MKKLVQRLLEEFQNNYPGISLEAMTIIIESLREKARDKGFTFNCLALSRQYRGRFDELRQFLDTLEQSMDKLANLSRCQILVEIESHWTCIDIRIREGKPEFYILDAANSPFLLPTAACIHQRYPDTLIRYSGGNLQVSEGNCKFFAIAIALGMARIPDLHDHLATAIRDESKIIAAGQIDAIVDELIADDFCSASAREPIRKAYEKIECLPIENMPACFGELLKTIQHLRFFRGEIKDKGFVRSNGKLLDSYIAKHTRDVAVELDSPPKKRNMAVEHFHQKIFLQAIHYLNNSHETLKTVILKRNAAIQSPAILFNSITDEKAASSVCIDNQFI